MSTDVQICNLALSLVGISSILALDSSSKASRECVRLYNIKRDSVLEDHKWSFATKNVTLSLSTESVIGWEYAYVYPTDCIKAREIYNGATQTNVIESGGIPRIPFEVRGTSNLDGRLICTNEESAQLIYTGKVTNTALFSAKFIDALSAKIASLLAIPLRADKELAKELAAAYVALIATAEATDSNEGQEKPDERNAFVEAR